MRKDQGKLHSASGNARLLCWARFTHLGLPMQPVWRAGKHNILIFCFYFVLYRMITVLSMLPLTQHMTLELLNYCLFILNVSSNSLFFWNKVIWQDESNFNNYSFWICFIHTTIESLYCNCTTSTTRIGVFLLISAKPNNKKLLRQTNKRTQKSAAHKTRLHWMY